MAGAYGFVETKGFTGTLEAADAMMKEANVQLVRQEQIGGGNACVIVVGDVGAVRSSVEAGATAAKRVGEFHAANVIPNLHARSEAVLINWEKPDAEVKPSDAIGLLEMQGYAAMVEATDAAVKAARVTLIDYNFVGSGYACSILRGDVAACRTAIEAGVASGSRVAGVVCAHVIARPHNLIHANKMKLGVETEGLDLVGPALGIVETKGFAASVEALDQMVKTANVSPVGWQKVGAAFSAVVVTGDVAACRSAVDAGSAAASAIGKVTFAHVIPRPHEALPDVVKAPKKHT